MKRSNADIVFEAIEDLHAKEQIVTRETLGDVTGLKLSVIDDRLGHLIDHGLIQRVQRGVFVPARQHEPARIISKTLLPDGTVKLEVGDDHVLTLTPREARMLAEQMSMAGQQFSAIELGHQATYLNQELAKQVRGLQRDVNRLTSAFTTMARGGISPQMKLPALDVEGNPDA